MQLKFSRGKIQPQAKPCLVIILLKTSNKKKTITPTLLTIVPSYKDPDATETKKSSAKKTVKPKEDQEQVEYESFKITSPAKNALINSQGGNVTISFSLEPRLQSSDTIDIYMNGKKLVKGSKSLSASFDNLDRGTHSVFAVVRSTDGGVLINSNSVKFHLKRNVIKRK